MAKPGSPPEAVATALEDASRAVALVPQDAAAANTLGVAQYRAGRHADALVTLIRSAALNAPVRGPLPEDLVFTAMAQWRLGRDDDARTKLASLHDLLKADPTKATTEIQGFLREAETLIGGPAAPTA